MTNWNWRPSVNTSWKWRLDQVFITTEAFDFLMTEDDNYIITDDSYNIRTTWTPRPIIT